MWKQHQNKPNDVIFIIDAYEEKIKTKKFCFLFFWGSKMATFLFRTTESGAILLPTSILHQQIDTSRCAFIKCFLALPQQKYKLVRTVAMQTLAPNDWIVVNNDDDIGIVGGMDLTQHSKLFLKLKLFASANDANSYAEQVLSGTVDVNYSIEQVLDTLGRSRSLRKLLVCK
jgi:hypothetical protein